MANSPIVYEEAQKIMDTFKELSKLQPKYPSFDVEGKRMFVEQMELLCDQLKVFTTRYQLSDDPFAKETVRGLSAQLLEAGLTIETMYEGLKRTTSAMRKVLEEEERLGAESVYKSAEQPFRELPDFAKLMEDPETAALLRDPEVVGLLQKAIVDPQGFFSLCQSNPKLAKIMEKLYGDIDGA